MKTSEELMNLAIDKLVGNVTIGDTVAHRSHRLTHTLIDIVGGKGVCILPDGTVNYFPVVELFDVNKVKNRAIELKFEEAFIIDNRN